MRLFGQRPVDCTGTFDQSSRKAITYSDDQSITGGTVPVEAPTAPTISVDKYQTINKLYLNGCQMGLNDNRNDKDTQWAANFITSPQTKTLDQLEQSFGTFTFAALKDAGFTHNYADNRTDGVVTNQHDGLLWTCVGFVACPKDSSYDGSFSIASSLSSYIYTEDDTEKFTQGDRSIAEQAVLNAGGVLYGESDPAKISAFLKDTGSQYR